MRDNGLISIEQLESDSDHLDDFNEEKKLYLESINKNSVFVLCACGVMGLTIVLGYCYRKSCDEYSSLRESQIGNDCEGN